MSGLLDRDAAAKYIGVKPKTLLNWRSLRKGPVAVKQGRLLGYRLADLDAYLAEHVEATPGQDPTTRK